MLNVLGWFVSFVSLIFGYLIEKGEVNWRFSDSIDVYGYSIINGIFWGFLTMFLIQGIERIVLYIIHGNRR